VVITLDFIEAVTNRLQEIRIGVQDNAIRVELDNGLRIPDCRLQKAGHAGRTLRAKSLRLWKFFS
jgi:hypothetical protein